MALTHDAIRIHYVKSDKDTHFTDALAQNAVEHENIAMGNALVGCEECIIEGVVLLSDQNLEWDVFFWTRSTNLDTDADIDTFLDYIKFKQTEGRQIAGTGLWYYSWTNLGIPYKDEDQSEEFHVSLCNRSATSKNAGATGEVVVKLMVRPFPS